MTRLYVNVRCEICNQVHARDWSRNTLGDKGYVHGVCIWCKVKELEKESAGDENTKNGRN